MNNFKALVGLFVLIGSSTASAAWVESRHTEVGTEITMTFCKDESLHYGYISEQGLTPAGRKLHGPLFYFSAVPNFVEADEDSQSIRKFQIEEGQEFVLEFSAPRSTKKSSNTNMAINIHLTLNEQKVSDFGWTKNAVKIEANENGAVMTQTWAAGCY